MNNKPSQQCIYPNCDCENTPSGEVICKYYEDDSPSQQMPAEGEINLPPGKWVRFPKGTFDKESDVQIYILDKPKEDVANSDTPATTISPTEEELEREAEGWAKRNFIDVTLQPIAKYCYLAAAKRYTRQGGERWISVNKELDEFMELKDFNTYEGMYYAPTPEMIEKARLLVSHFDFEQIQKVEVEANPNGTVSIIWLNSKNKKYSLEIGNSNFSYTPLPSPPNSKQVI